MVSRTYEKSVNLPNKKNMLPQKMIGDYFDNHLKENKSVSSLGVFGEKLIETFKKQNLKREKYLKDKEEEEWKFKHSKRPVYVNPWKATNHQNEYFSIYPGNQIYSYREDKQKEKSLNDQPFYPQKKIGDQFYSYREDKQKEKFLNDRPFYPQRKIGDYFYQRPSNAINHFGVL